MWFLDGLPICETEWLIEMKNEDFVHRTALDDLLDQWKASIDVDDIGGEDQRESVRAFVTQKCIEELEDAMRKKYGLRLVR